MIIKMFLAFALVPFSHLCVLWTFPPPLRVVSCDCYMYVAPACRFLVVLIANRAVRVAILPLLCAAVVTGLPDWHCLLLAGSERLEAIEAAFAAQFGEWGGRMGRSASVCAETHRLQWGRFRVIPLRFITLYPSYNLPILRVNLIR